MRPEPTALAFDVRRGTGREREKGGSAWGKAAARLPALLRYNRGAPLHRACRFFVRMRCWLCS